SAFHFLVRLGLDPTVAARFGPGPLVDVRGLPVLVVDDNETNRRILVELLTRWKMAPTAVTGGPAAISALERARADGRPYALVLLDGHMPQVNGFTVAEQIKTNPALAGTTVMMLTSSDQPGDLARCRDLGVAGHMIKPITQSGLWDAVALALSPPETTGAV